MGRRPKSSVSLVTMHAIIVLVLYSSCRYFETSAKSGEKVDEIFSFVFKAVLAPIKETRAQLANARIVR